MTKVIICIHGLDNKPPKHILESWWKSAMIEGLNGIGKGCLLPKLDFVYWADAVYDKPLSTEITNKEDPYYIEEIYIPAPVGLRADTNKFRFKVAGFMTRQLKSFFLNKDLSLKHSGIAQTIVQRFFRELDIYYKEPCSDPNCKECQIRQKIVNKAVSTMKKYPDHEIFLIGHSMGSIIGYDVLRFEVPEIKVHTFVTIGSPLGMPNVMSKIASKQRSKGNGQGALISPSSIENHWYNFTDIEDNVAINYDLADEYIENERGIKPIDVMVVNNYSIDGKENHHNSFGYLRTKEFAQRLAAFIEEKKPGMFRKAYRAIKVFFTRLFRWFKK